MTNELKIALQQVNEVSLDSLGECEVCGCFTKNKPDKRTGKVFCSHSCKGLDRENRELD